MHDVLRTAGWALLVASAYYVSGRLGLLLALPPGYATAVWPPSGIALAAVLLGGARMAPGIWLGSFLVNIGTGFSTAALGASLGVPTAIAFGATLQALLGARLIHWRGHPGNVLSAGPDVVPMLALGGPVACVVNATIGAGSLWLVGKVPDEAAAFTWWTWWIGDSIGVLLFAPLVLVWAVRPYRTWLRRQIYVSAPLAVLFAIVVALFVFISQREQARIETEFRTAADDIQQSLRVRLNNTLNVLSSIEAFYASSEQVEPYEFETFAQRLTPHLEGVSALSWTPVVRDGDRSAVEALGFDTASEPVRHEAMEQARDTGQPVASGRVSLVQNSEPGLLVILPVYRHGTHALEARQRPLQGYAVTVFSLNGLLGEAARRAEASSLSLGLRDVSALEPVLLYGTVGGSPGDLRQVFSFNFAGRSWELELRLGEQALVARRSSWQAWFVLAGGFLLTALLGILLLLGVGRTAQIETLVAERTDELRRTAVQLVRSNRELEQYAYVASHDLKAPLRTISSFAQLLMQRHGAKFEGEGREFLDFIASGVERMQVLIDDLLQLSRVDARKLDISPLSMRVAVDRACGALAADLDSSGARLEIGELPFVQGDLHVLDHLWQNLIANAIKFQPPGQRPLIRIAAEPGPDHWRFSISDNGIGIAQEHREQIFLVFRRLHTADAYSGTGIGLAICKKVVQLHGGEIWVEGAGGQGTTFVFTLPKGGPASVKPPAAD